jgi:hypothetical protein
VEEWIVQQCAGITGQWEPVTTKVERKWCVFPLFCPPCKWRED